MRVGEEEVERVGGEKELATLEQSEDSDQKTSFSSNSSSWLRLLLGLESGCLRRPMKRMEEEEDEVLVMGEGMNEC